MDNTILRANFIQKFSWLILYAFYIEGVKVIVTAFKRTAEEQARLHKENPQRTQCDGYKKISMHQKERAGDLAIIDEFGICIWDSPVYKRLGEVWEIQGGTWGGRWKNPCDPYHFQL